MQEFGGGIAQFPGILFTVPVAALFIGLTDEPYYTHTILEREDERSWDLPDGSVRLKRSRGLYPAAALLLAR
ncbi:MAG: hypothetical protein STSR0009_21990 [Methanoregula sp.]